MKDPVSREPANRASLFAFAILVTLIMSFYNRQLQVILQMYLSGNLSPFSEVYLYLKFTVSGQFVSTVCAFHGYAFGGSCFSIVLCTNMAAVTSAENHLYITVFLPRNQIAKRTIEIEL